MVETISSIIVNKLSGRLDLQLCYNKEIFTKLSYAILYNNNIRLSNLCRPYKTLVNRY